MLMLQSAAILLCTKRRTKMKKKIIAVCSILVLIIALTAVLTACSGSKNTSKLTDGLVSIAETNYVNETLSIPENYSIQSASIDSYGAVTGQVSITEEDGDSASTCNYAILPNGEIIISSSVFPSSLTYCGVYAAYDDVTGTYFYYDITGYMFAESSSMEYISSSMVLTIDDEIFIVSDDGTVTNGDAFSIYEASFSSYTTYYATSYNIYTNGNYIYIFDKNGNFVRYENLMSIFSLKADSEPIYWVIDDYFYVQETYQVADDASKYTVSIGGAKCNVETKRYSLEKGTVKSINFDYCVYGATNIVGEGTYATEYAVLAVFDIDNNLVVGTGYMQTFNKNLKVYVDLQELLPGANDMAIEGDYVILTDGTEYKTFSGKTEVASYYNGYDSVEEQYGIIGNKIYDITTNEVKFTIPSDATGIGIYGNIYWYMIVEEEDVDITYIVSYNLATGQSQKWEYCDSYSNGRFMKVITVSEVTQIIDIVKNTVVFDDLAESDKVSVTKSSGEYYLFTYTDSEDAKVYVRYCNY